MLDFTALFSPVVWWWEHEEPCYRVTDDGTFVWEEPSCA